MEHVITHLNNHAYKPIDITELMNISNYEKYAKLANSRPNVVLYFKRNKTNNIYFKTANATDSANCYFMNKNNYLTTIINDTMDDNLKRCIDGFLELTNEINDCMICYKSIIRTGNCNKCFYRMCYDCISKIIEYDTTSNSINYYKYKCPQCRQYMTGITIHKEESN